MPWENPLKVRGRIAQDAFFAKVHEMRERGVRVGDILVPTKEHAEQGVYPARAWERPSWTLRINLYEMYYGASETPDPYYFLCHGSMNGLVCFLVAEDAARLERNYEESGKQAHGNPNTSLGVLKVRVSKVGERFAIIAVVEWAEQSEG